MTMRVRSARLVALLPLLAQAGCGREAESGPPPAIVAIQVDQADIARMRAMATSCGATEIRLNSRHDVTLLIVGDVNTMAARDCFFEKAAADYRGRHPLRAWLEGLWS